MKKELYSGFPLGPYEFDKFSNLMHNLDAEEIHRDEIHHEVRKVIWWLNGVNIIYDKSTIYSNLNIFSHGEPKNISEVERIINNTLEFAYK
ncbi:MAG: hypothetical protein AB7V77_04390 [Candidatus Woesearchaeota archaeon]